MAPCNREALLKIWDAYKLHRKPSVAPTTFKNWYGKFTLRLKKMPRHIETTQDVIAWLAAPQPSNNNQPWSNDTQRRTLQQLKAATAWAKKTKLTARDPFEQIDNYTKPRRKEPPKAYTAAERQIIMACAETMPDPQRRWVHGLFLTGARPSELRALKRHHWAGDGSLLQFISAYPIDADEPQTTKNGMYTPDYPCNSSLQRLLAEATVHSGPNDWIFKGPNGGPFDYRNFQADWFGPLVIKLASQGKIAFPLSQYHARHTWITEALYHADPGKRLSIPDVSYLVRTSREEIMNSYTRSSRSLLVPEW
jgi:integrase